MKTVILIGHKMRQGKDTFARMLAELTGGEVMSFADPMKQIIADTFGMTLGELEEAKNDAHPQLVHFKPPFHSYLQTYRDILQRFGTEAMKKQFGDDVWARLAVDRALWSKSDIVIFSDLRFYPEYLLFKQSEKFRVVTVNIRRGDTGSNDHSSETSLDDFDYDFVIDNNGSLENLSDRAFTLAGYLWVEESYK
jgi:hypothetical protein